MKLFVRVGACFVVAGVMRMSGCVVVAQEPAQSISEQVREHGAFERIVVESDRPMHLANLVARADVVIEASTSASRSYLSETDTDIYTDYAFKVHSVLKNAVRTGLKSGAVVTVRRSRGEVLLNGGSAVSYENNFPPFETDQHYILFLMLQPDGNTFSVLAGGQGAFTAGEEIAPIGAGAEADSAKASTRPDFLGEVRALLKFAN